MNNFGKGHTDGDLWVYAEKADVLMLGDTYWNAYYSFIDNQHGGSIDNAIKWADRAIAASTDKTVIVPGHGAPSNKAELREWRAKLADVRGKVAAAGRGPGGQAHRRLRRQVRRLRHRRRFLHETGLRWIVGHSGTLIRRPDDYHGVAPSPTPPLRCACGTRR